MFEKELSARLENIFEMPVSFSEPGESNEQEKLFVEVTNATSRIKDQRQVCKVEGQVSIYGNNDKLKYGYLIKQIDKAKPEDKEKFFFYEFEENSRLYNNIVQRSFNFVYFFNGQYDPDQGSITSTDINEVNT